MSFILELEDGKELEFEDKAQAKLYLSNPEAYAQIVTNKEKKSKVDASLPFQLELVDGTTKGFPSKSDAIAYLKAQDEASESNRLGAARRGFNQGATAGFSDELAGGVVGAIEAGKALVSGDDAMAKFKEVYSDVRDTERRNLERDRELNPSTSFYSEIAGAVATPGTASATALKGAKGLSQIITKSAKAGAIGGAAYGAGTSAPDWSREGVEGVLMGSADTLIDTATGAAIGATAGAAVPAIPTVVGTALKKIGSGMEQQGRTVKLILGKEEARNNFERDLRKVVEETKQAGGKIDQRYIDKAKNTVKEQERLTDELTKLTPITQASARALIKASKLGGEVSSPVAGLTAGMAVLDLGLTGGVGGLGLGLVGRHYLKKRAEKEGYTLTNKALGAIAKSAQLNGVKLNDLGDKILNQVSKKKVPTEYQGFFQKLYNNNPANLGTVGAAYYQLLSLDDSFRKEMNRTLREQNMSLMFNDKSTGSSSSTNQDKE